MTSMIHKTVDRRRERRQRYKKYIDVFRERFHCTAAEVMGRIESTIRTAEAEAKAANAQGQYRYLTDKVEGLKAQVEDLKAQNLALKTQLEEKS